MQGRSPEHVTRGGEKERGSWRWGLRGVEEGLDFSLLLNLGIKQSQQGSHCLGCRSSREETERLLLLLLAAAALSDRCSRQKLD